MRDPKRMRRALRAAHGAGAAGLLALAAALFASLPARAEMPLSDSQVASGKSEAFGTVTSDFAAATPSAQRGATIMFLGDQARGETHRAVRLTSVSGRI